MIALTDGAAALIVMDAASSRRSVRYDDFAGVRAYVRVDLTVRCYTCPHTSAQRWAMVLDSDELALWDYERESDACKPPGLPPHEILRFREGQQREARLRRVTLWSLSGPFTVRASAVRPGRFPRVPIQPGFFSSRDVSQHR